MTQRIYDENGWLFIPKNPISKSGVFQYMGSEIGAADQGRIFNVLRSPDELQRAAESFKLLPIIDEHELLGSLGTSTDSRPPAGTTGEKVTYEHPYLFASLKITSDALQRELAKGKIELSPAYACDWVPESGTYEGVPYDYKQIIKHGNHLALVSRGRTGSDVAVLDHYAFDSAQIVSGKGETMNLEEILAAIASLSDDERKNLWASLTPPTETIAEAIEEIEVEPDAPEAEVEDSSVGEENDAAEKSDKDGNATSDEIDEEKFAKDILHKTISSIYARDELEKKVKLFIGAVPRASMDSAETVAAYTLKKLGLKHKSGQACAVLSGYLHNRKPESAKSIAQDSAPARSNKIDITKFGWEK